MALFRMAFRQSPFRISVLACPVRLHTSFANVFSAFENELASASISHAKLSATFAQLRAHPLIANSTDEPLPEDTAELLALMSLPLVVAKGVRQLQATNSNNEQEAQDELCKQFAETAIAVTRSYAPFLTSSSTFSRDLSSSTEPVEHEHRAPLSADVLQRTQLALAAVSGTIRLHEVLNNMQRDISLLTDEDVTLLISSLKLPISNADSLSSFDCAEVLRSLCFLQCRQGEIISVETLSSIAALCGVFVRRIKHTRNSVEFERDNFALSQTAFLTLEQRKQQRNVRQVDSTSVDTDRISLCDLSEICSYLGILRYRDQSFTKSGSGSIGEFWQETMEFVKHCVISSQNGFASDPTSQKSVRSIFFALDATGNDALYNSGMTFLVEVGFVDEFIPPPSQNHK